VIWEAFHTTGESIVYGGNPDFDALVNAPEPSAQPAKCCAPAA
jgi:hypothetical protein